ncbi:MAG: hypothetical protein ABFD21_07245 [Anaerolineaceae bacterium]
MKDQPKQFEDDDGRVICDMDVDGMPWHDRRVRRERRQAPKSQHSEQLSSTEIRAYTGSALLAVLLLWAVFAAAWALFILFCTQIWFR